MADNYFSNRISIDERKLDVNEDSSNFDITSSNYSTFIGDVGIQRLKGLAVTKLDVNTLPTDGDDTFPTNKGTFAVLESGNNNYTGQIRILDGGVTRTGKPVPHVGTLGYFAYNGIPDGWLECNGAFILYAKNAGSGTFKDTEFTELYNVLNTWTSANSDTAVTTQPISTGNAFKLPDFRGFFIRCSNTGEVPQTKYNTSNYKNHSHNGASLYSNHSGGSPEVGTYGFARFAFSGNHGSDQDYSNPMNGMDGYEYNYYHLNAERGSWSGRYNTQYSHYYGWDQTWSYSGWQGDIYTHGTGGGRAGGTYGTNPENIYSFDRHLHPQMRTWQRNSDYGPLHGYTSNPFQGGENYQGYWYWPAHIALSNAGTPAGSELLNSGYDGDRTSTAGNHRHGINVGPSYRGETETRATNIALKICIKY